MPKAFKFKEEEIAKALIRAGTISGAAQILKCDRHTISNAMLRHPALNDAIYEARERLLDVAESALASNIKDKHASSIFFYLKTQGKNRGYTERTEITGKDEGAINITNQSAREFDDAIASKLVAATTKQVSKKPNKRRKSKAKS